MQLLTPKEAAARLSVSPRTVYSWIAEGRLTAVHLSERVTRVPEEAVAQLVASAMTPPVAGTAGQDEATLVPSRFAAEESVTYGATATLPEPFAAGHPESESEQLRGLLRAHRDEIVRIVERSRGANVRVFGSVVHGDATDQSDIDLLIDAGTGMSLFDLSEIETRLAEILGRKVEVAVARSLRSEVRERVIAEAWTL